MNEQALVHDAPAHAFAQLATDRSQRDLFLAAVHVHRQSLACPRPNLPNLEATYNTLHAITMAKRMSLADITVLARATELREEGLRLARAGADGDGARLIAEARWHFEQAGLCSEGLLCAESFQAAAEAYISFISRDMARAEASLLNAIASCGSLRNDFGYSVELRRVHLGRNVVRVRALAGEQHESLRLASLLIDYIEGDGAPWPWPSLSVAHPDPLTVDARNFLLDQVLAEVAILLATSKPGSAELLRAAEGAGWLRTNRANSQFNRAHTWIAARCMAVVGDWAGFLRLAAEFFAESPGRFGVAWRELTHDLEQLGKSVYPEEAVGLHVE